MLRLPGLFRTLYTWYWRYIRRDALYAGLIETWREKTVEEYYALVSRREAYRERWFDVWRAQQLDFVLTVPNSLPAAPHGGMKDGWKACGYTFMFNVVRVPGAAKSGPGQPVLMRSVVCSSTTLRASCPSRT